MPFVVTGSPAFVLDLWSWPWVSKEGCVFWVLSSSDAVLHARSSRPKPKLPSHWECVGRHGVMPALISDDLCGCATFGFAIMGLGVYSSSHPKPPPSVLKLYRRRHSGATLRCSGRRCCRLWRFIRRGLMGGVALHPMRSRLAADKAAVPQLPHCSRK